MTAEQLLEQGIKATEKASRMPFLDRDQKKVARGINAALRGPDGLRLAELVMPYIEKASEIGAAGPAFSGAVDLVSFVPGGDEVGVYVGEKAAAVRPGGGTDVSWEGHGVASGSALVAWLSQGPCSVEAELGGSGTAKKADFTRP